MPKLALDDYIQIVHAATRLARNGLTVFRWQPGERFPHFEWANEVVLGRTRMAADELFAFESPFFELGNNSRLPDEARRHVESGDESPFEIEITANDASTYWVECVVKALAPAADGATRFVCATHPIERRKQHETFARLLATAVDRQPDGIFIVRLQEDNLITPPIVYTNAAFSRLTGYTHDDLAAGIYPQILSAPVKRATIEYQAREVLEGRSVVTELPLTRKDGTTFWGEVRAHPIESPPVHGLLLIRDLTERRRNLEEMSLLSEAVSNASDFVVVTDAVPPSENGPSIVYVNRSFLEATGYDEADVIGGRYEDIFSPTNSQTLLTAMRAAIEAGAANYREALLARKDGGEFWIEFVERPFATTYGRHLRLSIARDITMRRRASAQLSLLFATAEKAPTPIVIYEAQDEAGLAVAYENEAACTVGNYHLLSLWSSDTPDAHDLRAALQRGEEYAANYQRLDVEGLPAIVQFHANAIRNESRVEAVITQERFVHATPSELAAALPSLIRGDTPAERAKSLRALLSTMFGADLTIDPGPTAELAVRIDENARTALFAVDGHLAQARWPRTLEPLELTALRLCIETATTSRR